MKLRIPSQNKQNVQKISAKPDEFIEILLLNNLLKPLFESKIEKIKELIIYEFLDFPRKEKSYKRTLNRSKQ